MPIMPNDFNGGVFAAKYKLNSSQFWADKNNLICPSLPNLTENDISDCITNPIPLINSAVQNHLDITVKNQKDYDNMVACVSFSQSTNTSWAAEAQAAISWRDACWNKTFEIINQGAPYPSSEEVIAQLPILIWPD